MNPPQAIGCRNNFVIISQKLSPSNVFIGGPVLVSPVVSLVEPPLKAAGMTDLEVTWNRRYAGNCGELTEQIKT